MRDYQKHRITSFLNPEADKTGTGWHALQSQTAIGNGQLTGEGFMQGTQNQFGFLPEQYSDFPFAVFSEDWGFRRDRLFNRPVCVRVPVGDSHRVPSQKIASALPWPSASARSCFGIAVFNIGMATGVLPVVGITLPLFRTAGPVWSRC